MAERRLPSFHPFVRRRKHRGAAGGGPLDLAVRTVDADCDPDRTSIVDAAVYVDGDRVDSPETLADTYEALRARPSGTAWIGLYRPSTREVASLASEFELHEL